MRTAKTMPLLVFAFFCLASCRSNTTYKIPTQIYAPTARQADADDLAQFRRSYLAFSQYCGSEFSRQDGGFAFPIVTAYQTGLTLLAASEGKTFTEAATFLHTDSPDEYPLVQGFNDLYIPLVQPENHQMKFGSAVWMIWPTPMQTEFQTEMAERIGSDVVRLGNAGITPHNVMAAWIHQFIYKAKAPDFDKSDPIVCTGALSVTFNSPLAKNGDIWGAKDGNLIFLAWEDKDLWQLPAESYLKQVVNFESAPGPSPVETVIEGEADLLPMAKALGLEKLITGPNDLRNLSVEIIPQGDEIGVAIMRQYLSIKIDGTTGPPSKGEPFRWALYDRRTSLPLAIGRFVP